MKQIFFIFFLCSIFFFGKNTCAQQSEKSTIDSLFIVLSKEKVDSNRASILSDIIFTYGYYKPEEGIKLEKEALELVNKIGSKKIIWDLKTYIGRLYWRLTKFDIALKYHFDGLSIAENLPDSSRIIYSLMYIGQDYGDGSKYPEALKYFTRALQMAKESAKEKALVADLYTLIGWVNANQGNYPESSKNNFAAIRVYEEIGDAIGVAACMTNIADNYEVIKNYSTAIQYLDSATIYQKKGKDLINLGTTYNQIGKIYQKEKKTGLALSSFKLALNIATGVREFKVIAEAYRNIANVCADKGDENEALKNYFLALETLKSIEDDRAISELYINIGACFIRLKKYTEAKIYFDDAAMLLKKIDSESASRNYFENVELLDSATGKWKDAYLNYKTSVRLRDKIYNDDNTKKFMQSSLQYEFDKKEAAAKAEQEKKDIRQRTIRNTIAGTLLGSLIFLVVVYRQRNKISKERKRSDELLLNILPGEVADELKEKGRADAKQFDQVTVMFTDFKGFTQISEKLTAEELVSEIDTCFKAFDNIIGKHKIEKIKTIGDSYMCAGGLPVANKTHAYDVVSAAIEIQNFIAVHTAERIKEGREVFEIRIGIHTGPIVAGIVGVKKFAYDIWGDTVNIASRMESSGEPDKINISGFTYELVKDRFKCVHRGKIQAKNKGEIDMYFVESPID